MFEPKPFLSILADMVAHSRATSLTLTDYNVGSVTRSWLEANALSMDELWMGTAQEVNNAIAEATFNAFGFDPLPSAYALGAVTFILDTARNSPVFIPAGTVVTQLGGTIAYSTVENATIPTGSLSVTVPVRAQEIGTISNVGVGELTLLQTPPVDGISVTNRQPIRSGQDVETDAARRARFADYIEALSRGTVAALHYAARLAYLSNTAGEVIEQVRHVGLREVPGTVWLYIHNGVGFTSADLLARVREILEGSADYASGAITPGWRAAGVEVIVNSMQDLSVDIIGTVDIQRGFDATEVQHQASEAVAALIRNLSSSVLLVPQIIAAIYGVPGVLNLVLTQPLSAIHYDVAHRPVFRSLTLTPTYV